MTTRPRGPSSEALNAKRIVDLLQLRAAGKPDEIVYNYMLDDGGTRTLTYSQLFDEAQRAATRVLEHVSPGDRAVLLFGSGLDFVIAFMGCQVAGVVPVPVMPPRSPDPAELGRVMGIMDDARTNLIVTSEQLIQMGQAFFESASLVWMSVEDLQDVAKTPPVAIEDAADLALLQYTSGSTSRPRGVMVGHDNLIHNLGDIYWAEGNSPGAISVSWLPMSHDMGLIEGVLQPLYRGGPVYLMSPMAFLRRPLSWLEAISKYRATVSGGPNFAYDLVLRRLGDDLPPELDLSCWRFAYNGSEPVSATTIERFTSRLECRGFRPEAMHALFGIAEATLGVTEGRYQELPRYQQRVGPGGDRTVVSCGVTAAEMKLMIVDPQTHQAMPAGEEGEIWLNGPCITRGYWQQPERTSEVFGARIEGQPEPYMRTGDLGFIVDDEVYISGRIKEVIVSRGQNIHPQDMEQTAETTHPMVRAGGVVAFRIPGPEEAAGLVAEIDKKVFKAGPSPAQLNEVAAEIRRAVTLAHGVPIEVVALVKPGTLPRTTSGKRQRLRVAKMWQRDALESLAEVKRGADVAFETSIEGYLKDRVASLLGVGPGAIDASLTLAELGLDSLRTLELLIDVNARFSGVSLTDMLTQSLADLSNASQAAAVAEPWFEDAKLAEDIRCEAAPVSAFGRVLVTGATGFLGGYVATRLLATTDTHVLAMVRGERGQERLLETLIQHPDWQPDWPSRIEAVNGDLALPRLGMGPALYAKLAEGLDGIYHVAAMVNWVYPYRALSDANVAGTQALLRLACHGTTPFVYVSTSAVGWSHGATDVFDEDTDPMTHIDGIHLSYVRTKAVAESLVRQAASRGLAATVVRPGLIFSHSETGNHSPGDFLSALFKGCIEMGAAPDLDWSLEVCPVDDVARIVVDQMRRIPGVTTLHAEPPRKRLWRGAVLWMALRGYDVELLDYDDWCERLQTHGDEPTAALRPLLSFFTRPVDGLGLRLPQLYEETRRNPMRSELSRVALAGQPRATLDARLLEKTFDNLVDSGYFPAPLESVTKAKLTSGKSGFFEEMLRRHFDDSSLKLLAVTPQGWAGGSPAEHGIIGELASWRHGCDAGLTRLELSFARGAETKQLSVVLKAHVPDDQTLDVGAEVAMLCSRELGQAWQAHRGRSEVTACHVREPAIYALEDQALARHRPVLYGALPGLLVMEDLTGMSMLNSAEAGWGDPQIAAAITGIAAVHAHWLGAAPTASWLPPARECAQQQSLWQSLADVALAQSFAGWLGDSGTTRYGYLRDQVERWSSVAQTLPQTLIHNDFNPRNVALRNDDTLCAYDWELARVGLPQRDLAEFLCFTLDPDVTEETLNHWLEFHRGILEETPGKEVDQAMWNLGFGAALADFMVTRLPMYAMISRFHPQPFLERVVKTWVSLDRIMGFDQETA